MGQVLVEANVGVIGMDWDNKPWSGTICLGCGDKDAEGVATGEDKGLFGPDLCWLRLEFKPNTDNDKALKELVEGDKRYRLVLVEI